MMTLFSNKVTFLGTGVLGIQHTFFADTIEPVTASEDKSTTKRKYQVIKKSDNVILA